MNETLLKGVVIGVLIGVIATAAVGIGAGLVVMKNDAEAMALSASQDALVDGYATICVENFENSPNFDADFKTLSDTPIYSRRDFITRKGYATMPGAQQPYRHTADECARRLTAKHNLSTEG